MKIVAILGVKDELEMLPDCTAHLRSIGVDRIEAIDTGSTDGSLEWLAARRDAGELGLHFFSDQDADAAGWPRLNARIAQESGADRAIFLDADEFWIPEGGTLRNCASLRDFEILTVKRYNVPLSPAFGLMTPGQVPPRGAAGLWLLTGSREGFRERMAADPDLPWIRGVPDTKVAVAPASIGYMHDGGHWIDAIGEARRGVAHDLLIAHLPFTSLARFERKVENIRQVFAVHDAYFGQDLAWHWRRWLALDTPEAVAREYRSQCFDAAQFDALRSTGVLRTARELFREWGDDATASTATGGAS